LKRNARNSLKIKTLKKYNYEIEYKLFRHANNPANMKSQYQTESNLTK